MLFNIHGYNGKPDNAIYTMLLELGYKESEIHSPKVDYNWSVPRNPKRVLNSLREELSKLPVGDNIIIGNSYGGFFAYILAVERLLPVILVNPTLMPFLSLPKVSDICDGDYKRNLIELFGSSMGCLPRTLVSTIVGTKDEIINHEYFTYPFVGSKRKHYARIEGMGHSVEASDEFKAILNSYIKHYEKNLFQILEQVP